MEPTAPGAPFQNSLVECPNQSLANYMRCMLHGAYLGPEFRSFALIHAVRVYNMLPHTATQQTRYYAFTSTHPSAEWLRVFGCQYYARKPKDRLYTLDYNTSTGIFLGFTGTAKNVYVYDIKTKRIKTSTHGIFDEANITMPQSTCSSASQALIDLGYKQDQAALNRHNTITPTTPTTNIQLHTPATKIPTRCSAMSVGYDVYSTITVTLQPHLVTKVPLDITIVPLPGTYIQIHARSGLATNGITIYTRVMDPDYRGPISILMYNSSDQQYQVHSRDRVAQLVFHNVTTPVILQQDTLDTTKCLETGFGSTGNMDEPPVCRILHSTGMPYNIFLCPDPFNDTIKIMVKDFGTHKTMGLILQQCELRNRTKITDIAPSQPCSRIKNWRRTIKHGHVVQIEEHPTHIITDIKTAIQKCRNQQLDHIHMEVALNIKPSGIHPTKGIPQLLTDQLCIIQQHTYNIEMQHHSTTNNATTDISPKSHATTMDIPLDDTTYTIHRNFLQAQHPVIRQLFPDTDILHPATTQEAKTLKYKHIKDVPD